MHQQPLGFSLDLTNPALGTSTHVEFWGQASYSAQGDPTQTGSVVAAALQQATRVVVTTRLTANQLALPTLGSSLPALSHEIVQHAQSLPSQGITVTGLSLQARVPESASAPAAGQVMTGGEIAANIGGNFANNAMSSALDSVPRPRVRANIGGFRLNLGAGSQSVGDQVKGELKDRMITYAIVGGVLLLITGICVVSVAWKLLTL